MGIDLKKPMFGNKGWKPEDWAAAAAAVTAAVLAAPAILPAAGSTAAAAAPTTAAATTTAAAAPTTAAATTTAAAAPTTAAAAKPGFDIAAMMKSGGEMAGSVNAMGSAYSNLTGGGQEEAPPTMESVAPITDAGFSTASYLPPMAQGSIADIGNKLPQYAKGGTPNNGNPALILDLLTKQPVGTMNENGPESIVPNQTANMTVQPPQSPITASAVQQPMPVVPMAVTPNQVEKGASKIQPVQSSITANAQGASVQQPTIQTGITAPSSTTTTDRGFMGFGDTGNAVKSLARMVGYYNDMKLRQNPRSQNKVSAISQFLDWDDKMAIANKKDTDKNGYQKYEQKEGEFDTWGYFDPSTGKRVEQGRAKRVDAPGKAPDITSEESALQTWMYGKPADFVSGAISGLDARLNTPEEANKILGEYKVMSSKQGLENSKSLKAMQPQLYENKKLRAAFAARNPGKSADQLEKEWKDYIYGG